MTTANGLDKLQVVRRHIETLRERQDWVRQKMVDKAAAGLEPNTYHVVEDLALGYAIEVMEVEWDHLARMRRNVKAIENRLPEYHDVVRDGAVEWITA